MQLTQSVFKQTAKRLASAQFIPLASAQEQLAKAFGFTNLDAALSRLSKNETVAARDNSAPASDTRLWCGMPQKSFSLVLYCLRPASDPSGWADKGIGLLNAVLSNLQHTHQGDVTAQDLFKATSLAGVEAAYIAAGLAAGSWDVSTWPIPQRPLGRYLDSSLPAYHVHKLLIKHGHAEAPQADIRPTRMTEQDSMATEQHGYRTSMFSAFLDCCEAIEDKGGPDKIPVSNGVSLGHRLADITGMIVGDDLRSLREAIFIATEGDVHQGANRHHRIYAR